MTNEKWQMTNNKFLPLFLAAAALFYAPRFCAASPPIPASLASPLDPGLECIGTLPLRTVADIGQSNWTIGCETLDRDFADFDAYREYLAPLCIKTIRLQAGWAKCEKEKGKYDFAWLERIVDYAVSQGLNVLLETDYGNPIYEGGGGFDLAGGFPTSDEALAAWDAWVDALSRLFAGRVRDWAMWNEPDIPPADGSPRKTPREIAAFNVRTARIVKRNIPDARIGGLSLAKNDPALLDACLREMGPDVALFDWMIYHGYQRAPESSYANVEAQKAVLAKYSQTARMRQGENGCPSEMTVRFALARVPWSEWSQAKWDMRRMLGDLAHGVESSVFTICDFNHVGKEMNRKGLLRANEAHEVIAVKRAYHAVRNVAGLFDGTLNPAEEQTFSTCDLTVSRWEFRKPDGRRAFAFWSHASVVEKAEAGKGGDDILPGAVPLRVKYERPGDSFATRPVAFELKGPSLEDPVWVDLLTGRVYAFPKERQIVHSCGVTLVDVPVYDSPCVLTERTVALP